jgi:phospholipid transport system substrate-binding protein
MLYKSVYILFLLGVISLFSATASADTARAQTIIEENSKHLIDALQAQSAAIKSDPSVAYKLVDEIVLPYVDFERVARIVLGKYWRKASDTQRKEFTEEFTRLLVRTYVTAMVEFSDQIVSHAKNVTFLPFHAAPDSDDVTVRMQIALPDRAPVKVNYSLHENGDSWKIYDLSVEGVSLATTYRSSFATEIRRGGLDSLISKLKAKNAAQSPTKTANQSN